MEKIWNEGQSDYDDFDEFKLELQLFLPINCLEKVNLFSLVDSSI